MQYLGEDVDPNILLLLGFYRLHHVIHSEFEFLCCQDGILSVLSKVATPGSSTQTSQPKAEIIVNQDQEVPKDDISLIMEEPHLEVSIQYDDPNLSYSDTSLDEGALPSPLEGVVTNFRRK